MNGTAIALDESGQSTKRTGQSRAELVGKKLNAIVAWYRGWFMLGT